MSSRPLLLALAAATTTTCAATPTLDDAALWLNALGIRADLPRLSVRYGYSDAQGSDTTFRLASTRCASCFSTRRRSSGTRRLRRAAQAKVFLLMSIPSAAASDGRQPLGLRGPAAALAGRQR